MIRLHLTAEGQTEKNFANKTLTPHLTGFDVYVDARCVLTSKDKRAAKEYRGGIISYEKAKLDILSWLKEDKRSDSRFTTMFDLYALPNDFPGYSEAERKVDRYERVRILEEAMKSDIQDYRLIPYIQLHEFEALILASPRTLDWEYLEHDAPINNLVSEVGDQNPELVNDGRTTAPSKRILREIPEYDKVTAGAAVAERIGLPILREKCRHFNDWLTQLEGLNRGDNE